MPKLDVINISGQPVGSIDLADDVFAAEVNEHLLWEAVKWQLARRRAGTHSTKRRDEVSGTKKKPFKQKGTGRARQGSHRSPQWVGGGSVFGPKPRDYDYNFPKKARKNALRGALSLRLREQKLIVLDAFTIPGGGGKTKSVLAALAALGAGPNKKAAPSVLVVDSAENGNLILGTRNLSTAKWLAPEGLNVYDVLNHDRLVLTSASARAVEQALRAQ